MKLIVGAALRVLIVKTSFTDRYHDILYTFCLVAVGAVGTVEKTVVCFSTVSIAQVFHLRYLTGSITALLLPV